MAPKIQQVGLFEDLPVSEAYEKAVRVTGHFIEDMTPKQKKFNKLARSIEKLRSDITERTQGYEAALRFWNQTIPVWQKQIAEKQILLAQGLDSQAAVKKVTKKQKDNLSFLIQGLLDEAFGMMEPAEEHLVLWKRWAPLTFEETQAEQEAFDAQILASMVQAMYGIELDPETVKKGPEAIQEALASKIKGQFTRPSRKKGKTARAQKEAEAKAVEALAQKTIRSVYISLAKVLHPDKETNEVLKTEKETFMKEVTQAYEKNDLHTLLRLEMEWLNRESTHLSQVPDATLDIYLKVLGDQEAELRQELHAIPYNPRYQALSEIQPQSLKQAEQLIKNQKAQLQQVLSSLEELLGKVKTEFSATLISQMRQSMENAL